MQGGCPCIDRRPPETEAGLRHRERIRSIVYATDAAARSAATERALAETTAERDALICYHAARTLEERRQKRGRVPQRRALRLLRACLNEHQRAQLARTGEFYVVAPSGRVYRFSPRYGRVEEAARHGKRCFATRSFCLHAPLSHELPPADVTLGQLLLLSHSEAEFRETANHRVVGEQLWNPEWARTLREARREREAGGAGIVGPRFRWEEAG